MCIYIYIYIYISYTHLSGGGTPRGDGEVMKHEAEMMEARPGTGLLYRAILYAVLHDKLSIVLTILYTI